MTRFFFHFSSKDDTVHDSQGREFGDLSAAPRHGMRLIDKAVELDDMDWRGRSIKITVLRPTNAQCCRRGTECNSII